MSIVEHLASLPLQDYYPLGLVGFGLKIPAAVYEREPELVRTFLAHMQVKKYYSPEYPYVVGKDTKYLERKDKPHYHLHFIGEMGTHAWKTIRNYRNQFGIKDAAMKFYMTDGQQVHKYWWFAYASKEELILSNGNIDLEKLEIFRKLELEKKRKKFETSEKDLEEKDLKKELYNTLVEYFEKNCFREFQVHHDDAYPRHLRMLIIKYYRDVLEGVPTKQSLVMWQCRYFSKKWSLDKIDELIMGKYN